MDGFAILDYIDFYFGTRIFFISLFHRMTKRRTLKNIAICILNYAYFNFIVFHENALY